MVLPAKKKCVGGQRAVRIYPRLHACVGGLKVCKLSKQSWNRKLRFVVAASKHNEVNLERPHLHMMVLEVV